MKKLAQATFHESVGVVALFEPDILELMALMRKDDGSLTIEKDGATFDDVADLRENLGPYVRTLSVKASSATPYGHLNVEFTTDQVEVRATGAYETQYRRVLEFLRRRRRLAGHVSAINWNGVGAGALGVLSVLLFIVPNVFGKLALLGVLFYLLVGRKPIFENKLILTKAHEHQTFVQRHHENIWRLVIALASVCAGAVATWFLKK